MDNSHSKMQTSPLQSLDFGEVKTEIKILIVEDLESDRFSYKRYLQSDPEQKYQITEAETLEEGLELWRSQQPDVVLLDINLPDGDGLEFLEEISTGQFINKLPVIMLTGLGDERIAVRAMKLGAADYLVKSDVTAVSLITCINQVQENNLLFRQLRRSQEQQAVIASMALHIRRSVAFEDVANTIVQEIRGFLAADRTIIYRFHADMSGSIVAESVLPEWETCLNSQIEDTCFQENLGGEYQNGKIFAANNIYEANLTECHIQLLERFQIRANLVVPILLNGSNVLWGLLIVHQCSSPRQWHEEDIQLLHQLSVHLAISLQQAELYHNLQTMNSLLEERVQERTQKLQLQTKVLEEIHDAVVTTELDGTILSWNHGAEKLYGYTEAEILGRNVAFMYEDAEALQAEVIVPLLANEKHTAEIIVRSKSGQRLYVSLRLSVVRDEQGNITHLIGCANDITDRKQAEIDLKESEQSYISLSEASPVGIFRADPMGYCTYINDRWCRISGLTPEFAMGNGWRQGIHPEDRQLVSDEWDQSVQEERTFTLEYRFQRPDGVVTWVYGQSVAKRNDDGIVTGYVGTITDISDRKRAEQELQQLNQHLEAKVEERTIELQQTSERLALALNSGAFGCWEWNLVHNTKFWDERMYELYGMPKQDDGSISYEDWSDKLHPEDRDSIERLLQQAILGEVEYDTEFRVLHPNGNIHFIKAYGVLVRDLEGNPKRMIGINYDISDRKQTEAALVESEAKFRRLVEGANDLIWSTDANWCFNYLSPQFQTIFGFDPNDWIGKPTINLVHPEDRELMANEYVQVIQSTQKFSRTEFRHRHQDGHYLWVSINTTLIMSAEGVVIGAQGLVTDISDRKKFEETLRESEEIKRRILESSSDCIKLLDLDGRLLYINDGGLDILEIDDFSAFHNVDWCGLWPEASHSDIVAAVNIAKSGRTGKFQGFCPTAKGNPKWWDVIVTPIRDQNGQVVQLLSVSRDISDRKQAEQEILENQRFIQQIADSSPNVLYLYDLQEQRNTYANREILATLGYSASMIQEMGMSWLPNVIHPEDLLPTVEHFERLKQAHDGEIFSHEYRLRHANGEWRYFYSRDLIFSRDLDGKVKLIIGTAQDITDRKNAEAALRASDQRWQFALESAGDGIWDWDVQNNEVFFSPQWKALLGYTDDELENKFESWENLVHPDDIAQCYEDINKCLNHETLLYENEHRLRCKDGSYKWILARGKVFEVNADGQALRMMGTHTDLSDRKRAALELQQLTERLTLALRSGAIGCWDWNSADNSLYWDDRMYKIYGITKQSDERLTYDTWLNSIHPDDLTTTQALVELATLGISDFDTEFRIVRPDGEICFIKAYGVAIKDNFGNVQSIIGVNFDISDRKQAEAQLQQINKELLRATKLKDEFLANMSHELRTPLNAILGLSNVMGEQVLGSLNEKQLKAIGTVESSGEHLLSLINDILDLSKISSGMMELDIESVSVLNLCDSSLVFVKQQAFQKKVQIDSKIPQHINNINVEERRIRQVLVNLLSNAVKFTPSEGKVSLLVAFGQGDTWQGEAMIPQQLRTQNSPMIIFQVVDTGIGIDSNDLQHLFQPFVQVSSSLNRQYEGTGLGLALVKQIVELHGGQVMAESEVGKGSRFTFALPYDMAPSTLAAKQTPIALSPIEINTDSAIAPLILLVEDNEANIDTFTSYLTAINYRVIFAKNGRDALSMAKANLPDIILMDIQMPDIDGLEAIRLIRADESIAAIPIIAVTALAMEGDRERCLAAGANEYLSKPLKFRQLNSAIQQILPKLL